MRPSVFGLARDVVRRGGVVALYLAGRFLPRDPRIWVFGNVKGFRDNPRYLAEHIIHEHPDLQAWWIARTAGEAAAARAAGLQVALRGRVRAGIQLRAGVAFLSNGFQDLEAPYLGGSYIVDLRHGQGTKRILLDTHDVAISSKRLVQRMSARLRRWYIRRRLAQVNMIVAPGEMERSSYLTAFGAPASRIHVLGTPRFDVILGGAAYDRVAGEDARHRLGLTPADYVVLWLPTWRESGDPGWLPVLDDARAEAALQSTSIVLLLKPHPYSDIRALRERLPSHPRLRVLPDEGEDVNCLLRMADALVTDYSSAAFDYALLGRPILLFAPDFVEYRHPQRLQQSFETLVERHGHREWESLLSEVSQAAAGRGEQGRQIAQDIRARSLNNDAPGSCERIVRAVSRAVGLPTPRAQA